MTWLNKTKHSAQTPIFKSKNPTSFDEDKIVTPDGQDILVGFGGILVLVWRYAGSLWKTKQKTPLT